ncbi:restriction endonuclease subunit S [Shewanella frigidimarina]|uniref:restriction endonuclease subunit S n=1 Tax=Shewanella frigidimarina TaxID=56812 RepID=UPI003D79A820
MTGRYKTYPEYKKSGSKWLDEIPLNWKVTSLKHVLSIPITDGPHSTPVFKDEGVPFVSAEAVSGGYINFDRIRGYISEEDDLSFSQKYSPQRRDVYMIKSGATTGVTAIVETDRKFNIWSPLAVMRCKNTYNPYFLLNYLRSETFQKSVQLSWTFGTQQNIGMSTLENLTVCYPSFEEQQKIANFLDHETAKIDTLIAKQEKLIELLKEKRQAVISHAVTKGISYKGQPEVPMKDSGVEWLGEVPEHWDVIFIKHLSQVKRGASPRPIDDPKYFDNDGEYAWTRIADVSSSAMYLTETTQRLSTLGSSLSVRLESGELFVSIAGTVGKPCITTSKACIHDGFVYFPQLRINNKYLYYIFDAGQAYLGLGKMGTQLNLNTDTVGGIKIGLPPANEIEEIISYIEKKNSQYSELISKAVSSIDLMKERKTALISAAVTGKIDVRDWQASSQPNGAQG